ncbi:hypothetical protein [Pseudomonas asiatica]|uniref:hypothetical protein n=1 Tax=Pseudomonas asiatica TaxID=2219225 RepID=UPI001AB01301|nr:hypothetical protein [Pseudomonas asiatica]MBO2890621.1 hypothetical protein [Pseudomonas asiatica]
MQVRVTDEAQDILWVKTETGGLTDLSYRRDGTLVKIIAHLESALEQARGELICQETGGDVAQQNSAALEEMLDRQLLVNVGHNPPPDIR